MKRKRSKAALLAWLIAMLSILAGCNLRSSYVADIDDTMPLKGALPLDPYWVYEKAYRLGPSHGAGRPNAPGSHHVHFSQ